MKVNGKTTKQMVVAFLSTFLTQDMKETGLMIYSTESAKRLGTTARHATEDNFMVERRTDLDVSTGLMGASMRASSLMASLRVKAHTILQTLIRYTEVNSNKVTWMDEALRAGKMDAAMRVILETERKKERVLSSGRMETATLGVG